MLRYYSTDNTSPVQASRLSRRRSAYQRLSFSQLSSHKAYLEVTTERGFLPTVQPLNRLQISGVEAWEQALSSLPLLIINAENGSLQRTLEDLPPFPLDAILPESVAEQQSFADTPELWRAMMLLSYLGHAYIWGEQHAVRSTLPPVLAVPWAKVAGALGVPPVLNYTGYVLVNWRPLDPEGPVALGNLGSLANFTGGVDEEWFRLVHVCVEAQAAGALAGVVAAKAAAAQEDVEGVRTALHETALALSTMRNTLARMPEKCDPTVYYKRVRQPTAGWRNSTDLPEGVIYQGVWDEPQHFYGATGAQSSILPALDTALGVNHEQGGAPSYLSGYLRDMRGHMPRPHRQWLKSLQAGQPLRQFTEQYEAQLRGDYNDCVEQLVKFRAQHAGMAKAYIHQFNADAKGTGGSNVLPALRGYKLSTAKHRLAITATPKDN